MRFWISSDIKPHPTAKLRKRPIIETLDYPTPNDYDVCHARRPTANKYHQVIDETLRWAAKGSNHRIENGRICRDIDAGLEWCVEIGSLEELLNLISDLGPVTIWPENKTDFYPLGWDIGLDDE